MRGKWADWFGRSKRLDGDEGRDETRTDSGLGFRWGWVGGEGVDTN